MKLLVLLSAIFLTGVASNPSPDIVGGTDASIAEFPSIVVLRRSGSFICSATILNTMWALTAAHCIIGANVNNITILHSSTILYPDDNSSEIQVDELIVHEGYTPANSYIHDIGLMRLSSPVQSSYVNFRAKLPLRGQYTATGTPATVIGWGRDEFGAIHHTLQKVDFQIWSPYDCQKMHESVIHFTQICAGVPEGGKGECNGDSGGPLFVNGIQVGIVSWSIKPCANSDVPGGVYTQVGQYIDWIEEHTGIEFRQNMFVQSDD